jgi:hypothetical protein
VPNIKPDRTFDPFPRHPCLVNKYRDRIGNEVASFQRRYPNVPREAILIEAVRLAMRAEHLFKPGRGVSFATYVTYRLKELHRFCEKWDGHEQIRIYEDPAFKAWQDDQERGGTPREIDFGGSNAPQRLRFDWQWAIYEALNDLVNYFTHRPPGGNRRPNKNILPSRGALRPGIVEPPPPPPLDTVWRRIKKRCRVVFGLSTHSNARALADRINELRGILPDQEPSERFGGVLAAAVDHLERRQREADNEAEKRAAGDHSPTFLEAERLTDVQWNVRAKQPPRFAPKYVPTCSLQDAWSVPGDENGERIDLSERIASPGPSPEPSIVEAITRIEAAKPFLSPRENTAANEAIAVLRGGKFSINTLAAKLGVTKGAASKIWQRMTKIVSKGK